MHSWLPWLSEESIRPLGIGVELQVIVNHPVLGIEPRSLARTGTLKLLSNVSHLASQISQIANLHSQKDYGKDVCNGKIEIGTNPRGAAAGSGSCGAGAGERQIAPWASKFIQELYS